MASHYATEATSRNFPLYCVDCRKELGPAPSDDSSLGSCPNPKCRRYGLLTVVAKNIATEQDTPPVFPSDLYMDKVIHPSDIRITKDYFTEDYVTDGHTLIGKFPKTKEKRARKAHTKAA